MSQIPALPLHPPGGALSVLQENGASYQRTAAALQQRLLAVIVWQRPQLFCGHRVFHVRAALIFQQLRGRHQASQALPCCVSAVRQPLFASKAANQRYKVAEAKAPGRTSETSTRSLPPTFSSTLASHQLEGKSAGSPCTCISRQAA